MLNTCDSCVKVSPDWYEQFGFLKGLIDMNTNVETINRLAHEKDDELEPFLKKIVILNVSWHNRPLYGILMQIGPLYVSLTRKNGKKIIKIKRSAILGIEKREAWMVIVSAGI